jgi:hypothetical protein
LITTSIKLWIAPGLAMGDPVTRWMAANVAVAQDPAGNLKPAKDKSTERIDGIVALIMAIGRAMVAQEPYVEASLCEGRGHQDGWVRTSPTKLRGPSSGVAIGS